MVAVQPVENLVLVLFHDFCIVLIKIDVNIDTLHIIKCRLYNLLSIIVNLAILQLLLYV